MAQEALTLPGIRWRGILGRPVQPLHGAPCGSFRGAPCRSCSPCCWCRCGAQSWEQSTRSTRLAGACRRAPSLRTDVGGNMRQRGQQVKREQEREVRLRKAFSINRSGGRIRRSLRRGGRRERERERERERLEGLSRRIGAAEHLGGSRSRRSSTARRCGWCSRRRRGRAWGTPNDCMKRRQAAWPWIERLKTPRRSPGEGVGSCLEDDGLGPEDLHDLLHHRHED